MEPDIKKLNQLLLSGSCCSQALVSLGLTLKGEENPSLLRHLHHFAWESEAG